MSRLPCTLALVLCSLLVAPAASHAQASPSPRPQPYGQSDERTAYIRARYTKHEYRVPMRDGARLFTSVYAPADAGPGRTYPILMVRTPYTVAPYGLDRYAKRLGPTFDFEKAGYIFVFQDVRGRHMSEGEFVNVRPHVPAKRGPKDIDESSDTHDTITWLLKHVPHHNGRVGLWGISYPGFYAAAGAIDSHPALAAVSPQAPIADWYWDDMHRHGAFNLVLAFNFFSTFGRPRPAPTAAEDWKPFEHGTADAYDFFLELGPLSNANARHFKGEIPFWNELTQHPDYDAFWQARNLLPHLRNIRAAVLTVGGWYDTEDLYGPLRTYAAIEAQNPRIQNTLVMGPWRHGGWMSTDGSTLGDADFGFRTSETYQALGLAFFEHHLRGQGKGPAPRVPEALMFEGGANRWRSFDAWPPKGTRPQRLYLAPGGGLAFAPPAAASGAAPPSDAFVSDPAKPVPYTAQLTTGWAKDYMAEDQRFAARRPDVLVYTSAPLEEDLTLAGPLEADLWVSTTQGDADWVVKLIDVNPGRMPGFTKADAEAGQKDRGGQQTLVRAEVLRGRYRNGNYASPQPFTPGEPTRVRFAVNDVLHTFQRGHRVMVQVQSSWFPFVDRNPQKWVPNIFEARAEDFVKAEHRVYLGGPHASALGVQVLPRADD